MERVSRKQLRSVVREAEEKQERGLRVVHQEEFQRRVEASEYQEALPGFQGLPKGMKINSVYIFYFSAKANISNHGSSKDSVRTSHSKA